MELIEVLERFGALVVMAALLLTGFLVPKLVVEKILSERDKADLQREARIEDLKQINRELVTNNKDQTDAIKRLADALEARNRFEAEREVRIKNA